MVKIYYATVSGISVDANLINSLPILRRNYVLSIKDDFRRNQSVLIWKLLEYALQKELVLNKEIEYIETNGEWSLKNSNVKFSMSHSKDALVVAVSDKRVGVDVELCSEKILRLSKMFPKDCGGVDNEERLTTLWTQKESSFKAKVKGNFFSKSILFNNDKYVISVCSEDVNVEFNFINMKKLLVGDIINE